MYCSTCGRQIPEDANYCCYCGESIREMVKSRSKPVIETCEIRKIDVKNLFGTNYRWEAVCDGKVIDKTPVVQLQNIVTEHSKLLRRLISQGWRIIPSGSNLVFWLEREKI